MPELPDILLYLHALRPRVVGRQVQRIRLVSPFLLRSVEPPLSAIDGRTIVNLHRLVSESCSKPKANSSSSST
jgi:formamidopyrimidine-DNA glycosylase